RAPPPRTAAPLPYTTLFRAARHGTGGRRPPRGRRPSGRRPRLPVTAAGRADDGARGDLRSAAVRPRRPHRGRHRGRRPGVDRPAPGGGLVSRLVSGPGATGGVVLVTGAAGPVGTQVCRGLLARGRTVLALGHRGATLADADGPVHSPRLPTLPGGVPPEGRGLPAG